jgi:hypothetical protein
VTYPPASGSGQLPRLWVVATGQIMPNKLDALLERLKAYQRDLILDMAGIDGMPAASDLRQVAELENVIAAVEAVAAEEGDRQTRGS